MEVTDVPLESIVSAPWNPNEMDEAMLDYLQTSIQRFGIVVPLVVREVGNQSYETIGGAQRLRVLLELGRDSAPCVIVRANDAEGRLLSQALNHIAGSDNLGLRAEALRQVLQTKSQEEVLALLPETAASLQALTAIGEQTMAQALRKWELAQQARLRHLSFQLTDAQLGVVEEVLGRLLPLVGREDQGPNQRGGALYLLCLGFLEQHYSIETTIEGPAATEETP